MEKGQTRIKICGLTRLEDACLAVELGVDYLGFIFCSSPRRLDREEARRLMRGLPPGAQRVGVFMDQPLEVVREIDACLRLDYLQFHGQEGPEYYRGFGRRAIKAVRVTAPDDLADLGRWETEMVLLDAGPREKTGETGRSFSWDWLGQATASPKIILAGGLNPGNVSMAIDRVRPYAVDVCSGVESSPGINDQYRLCAFVAAARGNLCQ